jgi:type II secretory pathway component PulK
MNHISQRRRRCTLVAGGNAAGLRPAFHRDPEGVEPPFGLTPSGSARSWRITPGASLPATRVWPLRGDSTKVRRGMVLPLVLIVIALLSLAAYTFAELMLTEYRAAIVNQQQAQTRTLAETGAEFLQDFLKETDEFQLQLGGRYNNPSYFQAILAAEGELAREQGRFSVLSANINYGELAGMRYGVEDESARINLNTILMADSAQANGARTLLMGLPGMTEDVADSILDWIDTDDESREFGAELSYYAGLGYGCKNGPLDTIEELLLVRGVTPDLLFGMDANRNGMIDVNEANLPSLAESTASSSEVDRGWASFLTLFSVEANVRPDGTPRIDLNGSDLQQLKDDLTTVFEQEWVDFIIAYRQFGPYTGQEQASQGTIVKLDYSQPGQTQLTSVLDLVGAKVQVQPPGQQGQPQNGSGGSGMSSSRPRANSIAGLGIASSLMPMALLQAGGRGGGGGRDGGGGGGQSSGGQSSAGQNSGGQSDGGQGGGGESGNQNNQNNQNAGPIIESPFPNDPAALSSILPELLDHVTVIKSPMLPGRININQASEVVLRGIPGMTPEMAQRIVGEREVEYTGNMPSHRHEHWILFEGIVTLDEMKRLLPFITAGGRVFRAQIVGYFEAEAPASRVEVVINAANMDPMTGLAVPRVVFWRDLTNLGRGYDLATLGLAAQ